MSEATEELRRRALEARREKRLESARKDLIEAVCLCRQADDELELAKSLAALGQIERDLHRDHTALLHYEESAAIYRAKGDLLKQAHTIRHLGDIHRHRGHESLAEHCYREALDLYRNNKKTPPLEMANAIRGFALLKENTGEIEQAKRLWEEARELYAVVEVEQGVAESSRRIALLSGAPEFE